MRKSAILPARSFTWARGRIAVMHGGRKGLILLDQVRAVDKIRLAKKLGTVSAKTLASTLSTLQVFAE
jgi:mRNA interferase MazF